MKKFIFAFLIVLFSLVIFSGCEFFYDRFFNSYEFTTQKLKGADFLVKCNYSNEYIGADDSGYLSFNDRAAFEEDEDFYQDDLTQYNSELFETYLNNYSYNIGFDSFYKDFYERLEKDSSRAAGTKMQVVDEQRAVGTTYDFYIRSKNENQMTKVEAECKYTGDYCNVLFIDNTSLINSSNIDFTELGKTFDSIYKLETEILGSNVYEKSLYSNIISPNTKINIIVADLFFDAHKEQTSGTFGYFDPNDFLTKDSYKFSNTTQCIYVDSYFYSKTDQGKKQVLSTLVHEFNHLLNYCNKTVSNRLICSTWFTEMLSLVAEDLFQQYLGIDDIACARGRLTMSNMYYNYGFVNDDWWHNKDSSEEEITKVLRSYANAFEYGAMLVRNFGGVELLNELATNDYVDFESINAALRKFDYKFIDNENSSIFDDTILANSLCLLNAGNSDRSYITLNIFAGNTNDPNKLYFTPINLYDYSYLDSDQHTMYGPRLTTAERNGRVALGPYGISIHTIDSNADTVTYAVKKGSKISYYPLKSE